MLCYNKCLLIVLGVLLITCPQDTDSDEELTIFNDTSDEPDLNDNDANIVTDLEVDIIILWFYLMEKSLKYYVERLIAL